jgi:ATP-dependent exoDNAse (exonuclease V) alpha subunit
VRWRPDSGKRVEVFRVEERRVAVGDRLRWTRGDSEKTRLNGDIVEVVSLRRRRRQAIVKGRDGKRQLLDLRTERHWDHGYVTTITGSQGGTAQGVIVVMPKSRVNSHNSLYVAASRAQFAARIYTDSIEKLAEQVVESNAQKSAMRSWHRERYGLRTRKERTR